MHKFKLKQAVIPAHSGSEVRDTDEIVRLLPEVPHGELQYRIQGRETKIERVVHEGEIRLLFE